MALKRTISKCTMKEEKDGSIIKKRVSVDDTKDYYCISGNVSSTCSTCSCSSSPCCSPSLPIYPFSGYHNFYTERSPFAVEAYLSPSPPQFFYPSRRNSSNSSSSVSSSANSEIEDYDSSISIRGSSRISSSLHLSAVSLIQKVLDYIEEVYRYYEQAKDFTFAYLAHLINSIPTAWSYIHTLLKEKIGVPCVLLSGFVVNIRNFIVDEDLRDVTIGETADFFRDFLSQLTRSSLLRLPNLVEDISRFFHFVVDSFKDFIVELWLSKKKINFPCEFGKKSQSLFLCMECHREHY